MKPKNYLLIVSITIFALVNFTSCSNAQNARKGGKKNKAQKQNSQSQDSPVNAVNLNQAGKSFAGIYVASEWQKPIADYVLESPDVDGIFLRMYWAPMHPEQGKYDWSLLDSEMKRIVAAGKKASIGVMAGSRTPEWVYSQGAKGLDFTEIPLSGKSERVLNMKIPVPWDEKFLEAWTGFVKAMAAHLKEDPKIYSAVSIVKITGINENTIEIRLPAQKEVANQSAKSSDAPAIWKSVGYKPQLVMDSWKQIMDCFATSFPDKPLSLAVISGNRGFPPFDNVGNIVEKNQSHDITEDMIDDGIKRYKDKFVVQFNALSEKAGNLKLVLEAQQKGALTGYQLEQGKMAHPKCLEDNSRCDEEMFQAILDNGISRGALFIEIFPKNVKAYPKSIKNGHSKLAASKKD